jgi:hypothetical protein
MACLNITTGGFLIGPAFQGLTTVTTPNNTTITNSNAGFTVQKGGDTNFFARPANATFRFMTFGTPANFILLLVIQPDSRSVILYDTTKPVITTVQVASTYLATSATSPPHIETSAGNGSVFLLVTPRASNSIAAAIFRSDTGDLFCSVSPFTATATITGAATATQLVIKHGVTVIASATLPKGICNVTPEPNDFGSLPIGVSPPATVTKQFTVKNTGNDCLTVNPIGNLAPYTIFGTSVGGNAVALPVSLDPTKELKVDVKFEPTAVGTFDVDIPLSTSPVNGDKILKCKGKGRAPTKTVSITGSFAYGSAPLGAPVTRNLKVKNTGEVDITLNLAASAPGSEFQWSSFSGTITPGSETPNIPIKFAPISEGAKNATLIFTSNATTSPHSIALSGSGCVANAQYVLNPQTFPTFGKVQRGFRTVIIIRISNTGDGLLTFTARIVGTDAALFGIQLPGGSITSPVSSKSYAINPLHGCGVATGPAIEVIGITFHANDAPRAVQAQLIIESLNATNVPATITYNLEAVITAPVPVDIELVIDRSGSMSALAGERTKSETSISAGKLFVQLARPDVEDRIGIVRFNDVPEVVPSASIQNITSVNQTTISNRINSSNFSPSGLTCIAGGALVAQNDMNANPRTTIPPLLNKAILVLTDGIDNTPFTNPADGITYSLAGGGGTTALPTPADIKIYAVGIGQGENIDVAQLSLLAQATGGHFSLARPFGGIGFFQLEKFFTQIYMDTVDMSTIFDPVFIIQPGDTHVNEFDVLRGDISTMVVVYDRDTIRVPFFLETPSGETIDVTSVPGGYEIRSGVTTTARFVEVQLPTDEPDRYAGRWKVIVKHDGRACSFGERPITQVEASNGGDFGFGFQPKKCREFDKEIMYGVAVGVGSNFRMTPYVQPGIIKTGESIRLTADVTEFRLPVTDCLVTVEALAPDGAVSNLILFDDGSHQDDEVNDGYYGNVFTKTFVGGSYQFTFRVEGKSSDGETVSREAVRAKYVEGRLPIDPKDNPNPQTGKDCCRYIYILTIIITALLVIIILVLLYSR